jgi:peroxiredoxin Q/BCP
MLQVGDKLPQFRGINQNGTEIDSKNYSGKKLVVFFYPKASTPGCTAEACNLRDNYTILKEKVISYWVLVLMMKKTKEFFR